MLGHPWSTPIDIWSLGCLVFEYLVPSTLFATNKTTGSISYTDAHLARIVEMLGPFPEKFLANCTLRADYLDKEGGILRIAKLPHTPIERCLDTYKCLKPEELRPAADFIRRCLTIDPATRPTAKELLEDEWLKDV